MSLRLTFSSIVLLCLPSLVLAQDAVPQRVRVANGIMGGLLVTRVNPVYPPLARQARIQGTVLLKALISKTGDIENLELISGHPMLAPAAIEAVKQWKYRPYMLNGEPIEVETQVQVNFTLSEEPLLLPATQGDDTHPPLPRRVRVSSGLAQTLILTKVNPQYPQDARDQRIQGVVLLRAIIDQEGNVSNVDLISGHPLLAPAAIEAVKQWKYKPYLLNNEPIPVETQVQVNFTLLGK
jgi:TonB family protein